MENKQWSLVKDVEYGTYIDQDACSWDSPTDWLFIGILRGCGCLSSEHFGKRALELLTDFSLPHKQRKKLAYDHDFFELMAHWFDSKGLIEHGTSIGGSWLSEKGKQIHESITKLS